MFFRVVVLAVFLFSGGLYAQNIPTYRTTEWSGSGNTKYQQSHAAIINVLNLGASNAGVVAADSYIQKAIDSLGANGGIVYLPQGTYKVTQTLNLNSKVVLRGEGSDKTILRCQLGGVDDCIKAAGSASTSTNLIGSHAKGATELNIGSHSFAAGDWIRISQGDSNFINDSWSSGYVGQIVQISSVTTSKLTIEEPLRVYLSSNQTPIAIKLNPVEQCGVEDLRIVRNDATSTQTANIIFDRVVNGWIYGVESDSGNFSHISIQRSSHILVRGCYFKNAHNYGSGGKGYGVVLQYASGSNLITDNIFSKLRHAVLLQACPNGNVISYNYSRESYWTSYPPDYSGDIVMHGNYPFFNLFEGNIFQNLRIDNSHGINGPLNVYLRNRLELYGIVMTSGTADSQTFVGNEITGSGAPYFFPRGEYTVSGNGHLEYNNNKNGTLIPSGSSGAFVSSLYLSSAPDFWINSGTWPTIGGANALNSGTNPAKYRYDNINLKTTSLGNGTALPIVLSHFKATKVGEQVMLNWQTVSEIDNDQFQIFKSVEGMPFVRIGSVKGKVYSQSNSNYLFLDTALFYESVRFYQLHQVDFNGKTSIVGQVTVSGPEQKGINIWPNPVTNVLSIKVNGHQRIEAWTLRDNNGAIVNASSNYVEYELDTKDLPHGVYFLTIQLVNGSTINERVLKMPN